jgi:cell wall-associated NlpC family hydrolase
MRLKLTAAREVLARGIAQPVPSLPAIESRPVEQTWDTGELPAYRPTTDTWSGQQTGPGADAFAPTGAGSLTATAGTGFPATAPGPMAPEPVLQPPVSGFPAPETGLLAASYGLLAPSAGVPAPEATLPTPEFALSTPVLAAPAGISTAPTPAPAPAPAPTGATTYTTGPTYLGKADKALAFARAQIGRPCVWGATGPESYDCSSLTQAAWKAAGVMLPRTAIDQAKAFTRVGLDDLQPGDLVFFFDDLSHTGLCTGDGMMIHAPGPGASIREESVHSLGEGALRGAVRPA